MAGGYEVTNYVNIFVVVQVTHLFVFADLVNLVLLALNLISVFDVEQFIDHGILTILVAKIFMMRKCLNSYLTADD